MRRPRDFPDLASIPGARVLGINLSALEPPRPPEPERPAVAPGDLIVEFEIPGRPVPWSVPPKIHRKEPRLVEWQAEVGRCAGAAMRGRRPHEGPVRLDLEFHLTTRSGSPPDLSNLTKALEDACQGHIYVNDRSVVAICARRSLRAARDFARVAAYAAGGST